MKIGGLGDIHLRVSRPVNRTDDYYETQFEKLDQAFTHFKKEKCAFVLQPGDMFNNYGKDPYSLVYDMVSFLKKYNLLIYAVLGQHDVKFHNLSITDTPMQLLINAGFIHLLTPDKPVNVGANTFLYGASWNEPILDPIHTGSNICNILCLHKMVIHRKKLWNAQRDYTQAISLVKQYKYDLFVSGDNHTAFSYQNKLINCGSLCRMSVDQAEHAPCYFIYDTDTRVLKTYEYNITKDVLREEEVRTTKEDKKKKEKFTQSLHIDFEGEMDYRENINLVLSKKRRVKKRTKQYIEEALNDGC